MFLRRFPAVLHVLKVDTPSNKGTGHLLMLLMPDVGVLFMPWPLDRAIQSVCVSRLF